MQKKILIVDDEKDILMTLGIRLNSAGYSVLQTENAKDAIAIAKKQHPNLIILDIMMPEMDGTQAADILKHDSETKDIPIIFLTCLATDNDKMLLKDSYCLPKPYDPETLLNIIRQQIK